MLLLLDNGIYYKNYLPMEASGSERAESHPALEVQPGKAVRAGDQHQCRSAGVVPVIR
ncbi:MAG: hypothetical protein R2824_33760 [Saprospiraceae bacterium]